MRRAAAMAAALSAGCSPVCEPGLLCPLMGDGELGFNGDGLPALETRLASPTSVTVDPEGHPVVVDYSNMRVRVLAEDGILRTVAGNGTHAYSEVGADALDSPLENPVDARWGPDGRLYILPQHEGRVIRVDDSGRIELFACTGELEDGGDGGPAAQASMGYAGGMAFSGDGTLYVSDSTFSRVRRVAVDGTIDTVLGVGSAGQGALGYGPDVAVAFPERIALDEARRRLLVADYGNHRVLALDVDTLEVSLVAGVGEPGFDGDGGPGVEARLDHPVGVEVTPDGGVLIADLDNDALRLVRPDGVIETVAGGAGPDAADGWPAEPRAYSLVRPAGLAWTPAGDLLVAERGGHRVLIWKGAGDAL